MPLRAPKNKKTFPFLVEKTFSTPNYRDAVTMLFKHPSDYHACPAREGIRVSAVIRSEADLEFLITFEEKLTATV